MGYVDSERPRMSQSTETIEINFIDDEEDKRDETQCLENEENNEEPELNINEPANEGRSLTNEEQLPEEIPQRGRRLGITDAMIQLRHQEELKEKEAKLQVEGVRRSTRIKNRNENFVGSTVESEIEVVPNTYEEAIASPNAELWKNAMEEEIRSIRLHEVWEICDRPEESKVIKSKWIYSIKSSDDGNNKRYKARLVAVGNYQKPGLDYQDSFSPVIRWETFRTILSIAATKGLKPQFYDVKTA